jgi:hypothetical protein
MDEASDNALSATQVAMLGAGGLGAMLLLALALNRRLRW